MVVASATPPTISVNRYRKHPPYKEMILRAIATLKERGGSSWRSVSKFIADAFSDLPPAHEALLSHHLRRLRNKGLLIMHGRSYKLSDQAASEEKTYQKLSALVTDATAKRRRGRPASRQPLSVEAKRKPGRPRKSSTDGSGLRVADMKEKRKPGRPPKVLLANRKPGRPPKGSKSKSTVGGKRKPGRPKRSDNVTPPMDTVKKRKAGRPPKVSQEIRPVAAGKRKPGRPPKVSAESSRVPPSPVAAKRKPGRPPKTPSESPQIPAAAKKSPGRPPKAFFEKETRKSSLLRRKPGRPPKVPAESNGVPVPSRPSRASMKTPEIPFPSATGKRKPGRPPRVLADIFRKHTRPPKFSAESNGVPVPSRPSRASMSTPEIPFPSATGKRKPGRPPKVLADIFRKHTRVRPPKLSAESNGVPVPSRPSRASMRSPEIAFPSAAVKRKPGRPPKVLADSIRKHTPKTVRLHTETAALAAEKPRRGRPRVSLTSADKQMPGQGPSDGLVLAAELISKMKTAGLPESSVNTAQQPHATEFKTRSGKLKEEASSAPKLEDTIQLQENANAAGVGSSILVAKKRRRQHKARD